MDQQASAQELARIHIKTSAIPHLANPLICVRIIRYYGGLRLSHHLTTSAISIQSWLALVGSLEASEDLYRSMRKVTTAAATKLLFPLATFMFYILHKRRPHFMP